MLVLSSKDGVLFSVSRIFVSLACVFSTVAVVLQLLSLPQQVCVRMGYLKIQRNLVRCVQFVLVTGMIHYLQIIQSHS